MALLRSPRFSHAVAACVLGVVACGVSLALAGSTPRPPANPIDALPAGVTMIPNYQRDCAADVMSAATPPTATSAADESTSTTTTKDCWYIAFVRSAEETPNELADRLAQHYTAKGFNFIKAANTNDRSFWAKHEPCGTILTIDTGPDAVMLPPGARANLPATFNLNANLFGPGAPNPVPGASGDPAASPSTIPGDPAEATASTTTTTVGAATDQPPALPNQLPPDVTNPDGSMSTVSTPESTGPYNQSGSTNVYDMLNPTEKNRAVIVAVQQPRAVVPRALEGRC